MSVNDIITISDMEVYCRIGVPDEERLQDQRLFITLKLEYNFKGASAKDDIGQTIDYHAVYLLVKRICSARERKLIETLAEDIASSILHDFDARCVRVKIKKFILPETNYTAVEIERSHGA